MKAFTLIEVLVSVVILILMITGIYNVLNIGNISYNTNLGLLDLQQNSRQAMGWMVRELRESSPGDIEIGGENNQITFDTLNEEDIQYYRDTQENQIIREYPTGATRILANNIENLNFYLNGSLLEIQVAARKVQAPDLSYFLKERVRLRNE